MKGWRFGRLSFHPMMPRASIVSSRSPRLSRAGKKLVRVEEAGENLHRGVQLTRTRIRTRIRTLKLIPI